MIIKAKALIGSKVVSRSGSLLGSVVDFEIDGNRQDIINYYVQSDLFGFLKEPLVINANQVIEIQKEKIIVQDAVVPDRVPEKEAVPA